MNQNHFTNYVTKRPAKYTANEFNYYTKMRINPDDGKTFNLSRISNRLKIKLQRIYNLVSVLLIAFLIYRHSILTKQNNNQPRSFPVKQNKPKKTIYKDFIPDVYVITPTYERWTQKADLTRMAHSLILQNVNIYWIIVEDTMAKENLPMLINFKNRWEGLSIGKEEKVDDNSDEILDEIKKSGDDSLISKYQNSKTTPKRNAICNNCLKIKLLRAPTPPDIKLKKEDPNWLYPRGANQRNVGLAYISNLFTKFKDGLANKNALLYFADDDNTYDHQLFNNLKILNNSKSKIGLFPVGISGGLKWEGPICKGNQIVKFHTAWRPERPFPIDMAGFVLKVDQVLERSPRFSSKTRRGYLESDFLVKYLNIKEYNLNQEENKPLVYKPTAQINDKILLDVMGINCDQVMVWHTQTVKPKDKDEIRMEKIGKGSKGLEF